MGCCGCSLRASAIVAVIFGVLESIAGVIGCAILLMQSGYRQTFSISSPIGEVDASIRIPNGILTLPDAFYQITISALVVNSLWLLAAVLLIIGIMKESPALHRVWVVMTSIVIICDVIETVFIVWCYVNEMQKGYEGFDSYYVSLSITFCLLVFVATHGSLIFWIINICLTVYTANRAKEIEQGPRMPATQMLIYGGQPVQSFTIPGQVVFHNAGPSYQPLGEFENQGYRPDLSGKVTNGLHPDQKC